MAYKSVRHYDQGDIECWNYIVAKKMGYLEGNVVKYITRWRDKGKTKEEKLEDLGKCRTYIDKLIEVVDAKPMPDEKPTQFLWNELTKTYDPVLFGDARGPTLRCGYDTCRVCYPSKT